ncbi:hypothetical protein L7F22_004422 [Adiantum nelumboides]|nr:hypothetical protein [Adiantum nelumboides]
MAFPNFFGKQYESASNFLDDLEMAFLVSGRDEEEVKLRAFPLVLKDSAKNWFQNLEPGRKTNWETLKETFLSKYGGLDNPEHLWHRISSLHQTTSRTYLTYESQFLRLWAEWEASLAEGERAPNFLKKEKFLAGLFPGLQEKVKGKFPKTFEEALQIARVKDQKLEYQAHTSRVEHPQGPTMADERLPPAPTTTPEDPHLELLQRVTNQLDNLSINMVQGVRQQQPQPNNERMPNGPRRQPQRRDYFCYNSGEEGHGMYFCPHPRNFNAQARRGRQQVTPPRARPPSQIQPQILQNPQMVAQPQVLQCSVSPQPVAEIPPLPNNNVRSSPPSPKSPVPPQDRLEEELPFAQEKLPSNEEQQLLIQPGQPAPILPKVTIIELPTKEDKPKASKEMKVSEVVEQPQKDIFQHNHPFPLYLHSSPTHSDVANEPHKPIEMEMTTQEVVQEKQGELAKSPEIQLATKEVLSNKTQPIPVGIMVVAEAEEEVVLKISKEEKQPEPIPVRAITRSFGVVIEELPDEAPVPSKLNPKAKEWDRQRSTWKEKGKAKEFDEWKESRE